MPVGAVTIYAPTWFFANWSTVLPGGEIAVSNGAGTVGGIFNDGIDATYASPVFSAGFDFYQPSAPGMIDGCNVAVCVDSQFKVRLLSGATVLATIPWTPFKDDRTFFGVWSDTAFDKLEIREIVGTDDNEFYGQFYSGTVAAPVPEPAGWLLGAAGLLMLRGLRRRR
jgi:MYXO-CTERM domain-containing protein